MNDITDNADPNYLQIPDKRTEATDILTRTTDVKPDIDQYNIDSNDFLRVVKEYDTISDARVKIAEAVDGLDAVKAAYSVDKGTMIGIKAFVSQRANIMAIHVRNQTVPSE